MELILTRPCDQARIMTHPLAVVSPALRPSSSVAAITNHVATNPGQHEVPLRSSRDAAREPTPKTARFAAFPRERPPTIGPRAEDSISNQSRTLPTPGPVQTPTAATASVLLPDNSPIPTADSSRQKKREFIKVNRVCCRNAFGLPCLQDTSIYFHDALQPVYFKSHQGFTRRRSPRPASAALTHTPKGLSMMDLLDYFVHGKEQETNSPRKTASRNKRNSARPPA